MLLELFKQTSLRIANGRYGSDKVVGNFTCTTSRGQSLVDYVLPSKHILNKIDSFDVCEPNILSNLISFSLNVDNDAENQVLLGHVQYDYKYQWKSEKAEGFVDSLSTKPSAFSDFH